MKTIYVATYGYYNQDEADRPVKASTSLCELQTWCLKQAEKFVKEEGNDVEYKRVRHHRVINIVVVRKDDPDDGIAWWEIRPVGVI